MRNVDTGYLVTLSAQAAATLLSSDLLNVEGSGVSLIFDLTTMTAATVTVTIQGKDVVSGKYYDLLASAGKTATGTNRLFLFPGATAATNVSVNDHLPAVWRVKVVVADNSGTAAVTGTVGASILL